MVTGLLLLAAAPALASHDAHTRPAVVPPAHRVPARANRGVNFRLNVGQAGHQAHAPRCGHAGCDMGPSCQMDFQFQRGLKAGGRDGWGDGLADARFRRPFCGQPHIRLHRFSRDFRQGYRAGYGQSYQDGFSQGRSERRRIRRFTRPRRWVWRW
jgi:hypothetical protein